ncbi:MAG: hypothetical protein A2664_02930 [Candidatus Taylorbacteria bacterium RIFCSPHIGHO2_01_FULL_46_22b]|uniref:NodB homology domain-containing protein n=1 Tax=Candidatus Taylorbacteria bacterium RIFCSPHIGHO2_01_FULL_46_22b TaxID=1802301 RepID=A0A1G2M3X4_9BACT|nr:MAG: hypothetical protein A2664_02930 [Candidatus Taylorbacteria bacterium RIFCSPHIGHO2_01_FULL_46_22b]
MKRLLIALAIAGIWRSTTVEAGALDNTAAIFSPAATPIKSDIHRITPEIVKVSWAAEAGKPYIIEHAPTPIGPWRTFSVELGVESSTRRSMVIADTSGFFRILSAAKFPTGASVDWKLQFPALSPQTEHSYTATWVWDNGGTSNVTGGGWNTPLTKTYPKSGVQQVNVVVRDTNSSVVFSSQWAIVVTNNPSNLITNGNLETTGSLPTAWTKDWWGTNGRTFTYPVAGPSGNNDKAAQVSITNYQSGDAKWRFSPVPVNPNSLYVFEDDYKANVPTEIDVEVITTAGTLYPPISYPPASSNWAKVRAEFVTPSNVLSVSVTHLLTTNGTLTIDNASLRQSSTPTPLTEGMVSFDFDDGWRATYLTATNTLGKAGLRGTFYIITSRVDIDRNFVTSDDLQEIQRGGHEIGNHTTGHLDLTTLSTTQSEQQVNLAGQFLITRGARVSAFAYPFGAYNAEYMRLVREAGYGVGRVVWKGLNVKGGNLYELKAWSLKNTDTFEGIRSLIDQARNNKEWLVLVFHHVNDSGETYAVKPTLFNSVVDYVATNHVKVVTASEGARLMSAP